MNYLSFSVVLLDFFECLCFETHNIENVDPLRIFFFFNDLNNTCEI